MSDRIVGRCSMHATQQLAAAAVATHVVVFVVVKDVCLKVVVERMVCASSRLCRMHATQQPSHNTAADVAYPVAWQGCV